MDVKTFDTDFRLSGDYPRQPEPTLEVQPLDYVADDKTLDLFGAKNDN